MASKKRDWNEDPITGEPGAHPVGVGVGTAGGAAAGAAVGSVAGPVGTVAGAIIGGVTGGLAGKAAAEGIDPTAEDAYWRKNYRKREYVQKGEKYDTYRPAYQYGWESGSKYSGKTFDKVESKLAKDWDKARGNTGLAWDRARDAVRDAFDRTIELREEQLDVHKQPANVGEVRVRKEVVTEHKKIDVPVTREEVVVTRRPVSGRAARSSDIRAGEEIRIPVKEEKVRVDKRTVAKEEVTVGKRKVQDTQRVGGSVRKEQLRVEKTGDAKVNTRSKSSR